MCWSSLEPLDSNELQQLIGMGCYLQISRQTQIDFLWHEQDITALATKANQKIPTLLTEFVGVFAKPVSLPPFCRHDHQIPLKANHEPVSVRPYRYPHYQKVEIEHLVQEFLTSRTIRHSSSPFSSPILFVKKSDGTWHFYIDYKVLNEATIKDKHPIPIIDELLTNYIEPQSFPKWTFVLITIKS